MFSAVHKRRYSASAWLPLPRGLMYSLIGCIADDAYIFAAAAAAAAAVLQVGDKIKYIKVVDGLQNMVNL
jgi:hypothetical protein